MATKSHIVRDGLIVGVIAYASVAVFYAFFDLLAARGTLYTVNLLGQSTFRGLRDPAVLAIPQAVDLPAILWYNGFHLAASVLIGLVVTGLVERSERQPSQIRLIQVTIVAGFAITILAVGLLTTPMRPLLPWWSIVVANTLAVLMAGAYLMRKRPGAWQRLGPFASAGR